MPTVAELGKLVKAKHPGAYDSIPDDELGRKVQSKYPGSYDSFTDTQQQLIATPSLPQRLVNRARSAMPFGGGFLGATVGTPGGVPGRMAGAGIGGAIGEFGKQVSGGPSIPGMIPIPIMSGPVDVGKIAKAGTEQAALQGGGELLGAAANKLAGPLMKSAIRPGRLLEKFPHIVQDALSHAAPVGGGATKAAAYRSASSDKLMELLSEAAQAGKNFSAADVTAQNRSMLGDLSIDPADRAAIARRTQAFVKQFKPDQPPPIVSKVLDQWGNPVITEAPIPEETKIGPELLKKIKQRGQNKAANTLKAGLGGSSREMYPKGLATGAQKQLETIDKVGAQEAYTQRMIGLEEALRRAEARHGPVRAYEMAVGGLTGGGVGMAFGHAPELAAGGLMAAPLARMITSPQLTSRAAIFMNSVAGQRLLKQSPRLFFALVSQATYQQPDATVQP